LMGKSLSLMGKSTIPMTISIANCECLPEAILKVYQDTSGCNPALQQQNSRVPKTGCRHRFSILVTKRGKRLPESETQRLHRVASCLWDETSSI
jgi:hypothetical protein